MPRILRRDAEKLLANVPEEHAFRSCDGTRLLNMNQLGEALNTMTDETFTHHSSEEKKDFGNWVRDVIGGPEAGDGLGQVTDWFRLRREVDNTRTKSPFIWRKL